MTYAYEFPVSKMNEFDTGAIARRINLNEGRAVHFSPVTPRARAHREENDSCK